MLGPLISAGASLIGGLINKSSADDAREAQAAANERNIALQKEFAQNGIQWKVADARAAGIHPIYALGGSTASFTPTSSNFSADTSIGSALASGGQDIGKAIDKASDAPTRADNYTRLAQKLELEGKGLQNDILRQELASKVGRISQTPSPPIPSAVDPYLIPGQSGSGLVKRKPVEIAPSPSNAPHNEAGAVADLGYARTQTGWAPVPSKDVKDRIEDNFIPETSWAIRNHLLPSLGVQSSPPPFAPPAGKMWYFDPIQQEYRLATERYRLNNPFKGPKQRYYDNGEDYAPHKTSGW